LLRYTPGFPPRREGRYFAYCGAVSSEIAIAKWGPDGWIKSELLSAGTGKLISKITKLRDEGYWNFKDLGSDGKNLIVRVGWDHATDKPDLLWVFSLGEEKILTSVPGARKTPCTRK
jgi:hypothetical protein